MFAELRELLRSGAIRRHQLGAKYLLTPTSFFNLITRLGIKAFSYCTSYYAFSIFAAIFCAITISTMAATANNADPMKPMVY